MAVPAFSVIIPVFNDVRHLGRCLDSLLVQTNTDWEAVCVDDGSTDGTSPLLDEFARKDSRIKAIHKSNEGVSIARNTAMQHTSGSHIVYVDSDDFLHPQTFELCSRIIADSNPDLIAYTYNRKYRRNLIISQLLHLPDPRPVFTTYNPASIDYRLTDNIYEYATEYSRPKVPESQRPWLVKHCQPWRCMYKKEIVEDIRFVSGIIYEDFPWWGEVLLKVRNAAILNLPLYYYYPNPHSYIMASKKQFKIESLKKALAISESYYESHATPYQREMWHKNFIVPFKEKLAKKQR